MTFNQVNDSFGYLKYLVQTFKVTFFKVLWVVQNHGKMGEEITRRKVFPMKN